ncbi:hypothetical protein JOB18_007944 [Solea senegalensis]|uniref:ATP synthase F1 subunit delta n=1 Tax=Solea senegalensis TaxID=28829 RepID=A0AAV6RX11_SOLSE|nr:hypothetical protein JOB18_007944 [Solea senegalensis]
MKKVAQPSSNFHKHKHSMTVFENREGRCGSRPPAWAADKQTRSSLFSLATLKQRRDIIHHFSPKQESAIYVVFALPSDSDRISQTQTSSRVQPSRFQHSCLFFFTLIPLSVYHVRSAGEEMTIPAEDEGENGVGGDVTGCREMTVWPTSSPTHITQQGAFLIADVSQEMTTAAGYGFIAPHIPFISALLPSHHQVSLFVLILEGSGQVVPSKLMVLPGRREDKIDASRLHCKFTSCSLSMPL